MSLPRELKLREEDGTYIVSQDPVSEIKSLTVSENSVEEHDLKDGSLEQPQAPFKLDIDVLIENKSSFEVRLFVNEGVSPLIFGIDRREDYLFIKRHLGPEEPFSKDFPGIFTTPIKKDKETFDVTLICDHSSVEVFVNEGEYVMTNLCLPADSSRYAMDFASKGNAKMKKIVIRELASVMVESTS